MNFKNLKKRIEDFFNQLIGKLPEGNSGSGPGKVKRKRRTNKIVSKYRGKKI